MTIGRRDYPDGSFIHMIRAIFFARAIIVSMGGLPMALGSGPATHRTGSTNNVLLQFRCDYRASCAGSDHDR